MFDWNDLRYFLAISRSGSIGTAAAELRVNPSTVQRRLRALESALDCTLAERRPEGYRLTLHGERLLEYAEQVEASIGTFHRQSVLLARPAGGAVKLTSHVTVGQRIIKSGFLDRFHATHPGIKVELMLDQRPLHLSRGEADIAIRGGRMGNDAALVGRKIAELPWAIYASRGFVERYGRPSGPADLNACHAIEMVEEIATLPAAQWMKANAPNAPVAARCSNVPSVHLAIKSGAGIGPLPAVYAAEDDELVCVLGPLPELNYPMFLLARKDLRGTPPIRMVFDYCLRELKTVLTRGKLRSPPPAMRG